MLDVNNLKPEDTIVKTVGEAKIDTPFQQVIYDLHKRRVLHKPYEQDGELRSNISFEVTGASEKIYFDPKNTKAAIVTCGGICPGLNNVIRAIVLGMHHHYGVKNIFGIRYGLEGFIPKYGHDVIEMTPEVVSKIHNQGGTILGTSRGEQPMDEIVDFLDRMNIKILFIIGGDGTLRAAQKIQEEIERRNLKISVVGVPKTIDNDISFVARSFGFETAVNEATKVIRCAHVEAKASPMGVGLVKLMGRHSGFIAATAAVAQRDVNFVLIPEVDFDLEGEKGLLKRLETRLKKKSHAVIVVAEGAGQKFFKDEHKTDASGNVQLSDIGLFLKDKIKDHFTKNNLQLNLKYIDPSYIIRSVPSNTNDNLFCATLGENAVHAAMAGKTSMLASMWHGVYCNIPIALATSKRKQIAHDSRAWLSVLEATGQPNLKND
ncbi:MAG: 6-phosphofructokinase 1 [bacterium]|jgi:6-phosphofructokinase 1